MSSEKTSSLRFLTIEQVAEALNVGVPQIRSLLKSGELRGFQIGGRHLWRIGADDFENYIMNAYDQTAKRIASDELLMSRGSQSGEEQYEL